MIEGFKKQGLPGAFLDALLVPLMYVLQGNIHESPQRTHRWNNTKITQFAQIVKIADRCEFITIPGDLSARVRWLGMIPLFHIPLLGGWKKYVVLQPKDLDGEWFVGWSTKDVFGISQVPIVGPVRLLIGKHPVSFFGLTEGGDPVSLQLQGEGTMGVPGPYSKVPLR